MPSVVPSLVEALVLSSKAIKLHWTISYAPEREIIDGFFVGYRSFSSTSASSGAATATAEPRGPNPQAGEQPTFTYKTIRLTNQAPGQTAQELQQHDDQSALLSPVSSVTKQVPVSQQTSQLMLVSTFEFLISGLERNTEYTILIQCFNKKGAGPTSDPVVFKTFAIGKLSSIIPLFCHNI